MIRRSYFNKMIFSKVEVRKYSLCPQKDVILAFQGFKHFKV